MTTTHCCPGPDCPTLGVDAVSLDAFRDVDTDDGDRIVFDEENQHGWIQSDTYARRDAMS